MNITLPPRRGKCQALRTSSAAIAAQILHYGGAELGDGDKVFLQLLKTGKPMTGADHVRLASLRARTLEDA